MNATTLAIVEAPAESAPLGEVSAAWLIAPGALLMLGWCQDRPATDGAVNQHQRAGQRGRFHSLSWPRQTDAPSPINAHQFIAAVRLPSGEGTRPGETLVLKGAAGQPGMFARLPVRFLAAAAFGAELAALAGSHCAAVAQFLLQTFAPAATRDNSEIYIMWSAFLARACAGSGDGCIEMAGAIPDHCVVLQGWGSTRSTEAGVLLVGETIDFATVRLARFSRPDLDRPATGQLFILTSEIARLLPTLTAAVLFDRDSLKLFRVIPERRLLLEADTRGELNDLLPRLRGDSASMELLSACLRPRFQGRFTLYDGGHPVRVAIDLAATAAGAGLYLTGWMYDPTATVSELHLGYRSNHVRLDRRWVRVIRPDVTDAFHDDPGVPNPSAGGDHAHGFAVHLPEGELPGGSGLHLEFHLRDGFLGFMPLEILQAEEAATREKLLASLDLHKPSGMEVLEGHLAPFFAKLQMDGNRRVPVVISPIPASWTRAIVVPLPDPMNLRAFLAQFLRDPLSPDEGLVFVCGSGWARPDIDGLRRLAAFYGTQAALLQVGATASAAVAIEAVTALSGVQRLLLMHPSTTGRSRGWRQALHGALRSVAAPACICPTVRYEDESLRFAGSDDPVPLDGAPYIRMRQRLAGMPASLVADLDTAPSAGGTVACCLISRQAAEQASAALRVASGSATTLSVQEAQFFLALRQAGVAVYWCPSADVYAPDLQPSGLVGDSGRVSRLVDLWCLRAQLKSQREPGKDMLCAS